MPDTVVFIPAWNEEQNLPAVLDELRAGLPDADVLVVDDGSTDGTAEIARGHGAEVLSFGENRGLRAGIAAGYAYAAEHGYAFAGESKLRGRKAVQLVATVVGTLVTYGVWRRLRRPRGRAAPRPARGIGRTGRVLATDEHGSLAARARELVCWVGVPFAAPAAKRRRRA